MRFAEVAHSDIVPNPDQPRKAFGATALRELADSIGNIGLMQPLTVRESGDKFQIVAGERRWRAIGMNGTDRVQVVIVEKSDDETLVLATAENVNRQDMTCVEEANAYQRIITGQGRTIVQVAALFGKTVQTVQYRIDLLDLDDVILDMLDKGYITIDSGWYLSRISLEGQRSVWRRFTAGEFDDEAAMRVACRAQRTLESEPTMFAMESEETVEKRREVKSKVDTQLANVKRSHEALDRIMDISDEDLVLGLGQGLDDLAAALKALESHARTVRNRVDKTKALREQHEAR